MRLDAERARGLTGSVKPLAPVSKLSRQIADSLNKNNPNRQPLAQAGHNSVKVRQIKRAKFLEAGIDSTCFSGLTWTGGIATATFARDGAVYEYELTREEFLEWVASGSLGQFFNAEIR